MPALPFSDASATNAEAGPWKYMIDVKGMLGVLFPVCGLPVSGCLEETRYVSPYAVSSRHLPYSPGISLEGLPLECFSGVARLLSMPADFCYVASWRRGSRSESMVFAYMHNSTNRPGPIDFKFVSDC